jgi:hypothetical protein
MLSDYTVRWDDHCVLKGIYIQTQHQCTLVLHMISLTFWYVVL